MGNALVPEFAVSDWQASRAFYCDVLGFDCLYERPEEGFCYLRLGEAELMIDQIGFGRTFGGRHRPDAHPFGRGLNVQIRVPTIAPLVAALAGCGHPLVLPVEEKWYRLGPQKAGQRQFVVADPDGYLLRFHEELGLRPRRGSAA
ncbi:bleomycin resistance protein [Histidinibacterium lentulum]|uniref:Bleomycin resistance protein n=1 Tax=Histidinibacterium lentulum TaxID=2480588 RepID=A0A3N2R7Y1_9RHOB|nr:VOC family protein [Histidinibacterium lentulum]ROU03523.1 VOC family protein [Histidinibacterium lentulum]